MLLHYVQQSKQRRKVITVCAVPYDGLVPPWNRSTADIRTPALRRAGPCRVDEREGSPLCHTLAQVAKSSIAAPATRGPLWGKFWARDLTRKRVQQSHKVLGSDWALAALVAVVFGELQTVFLSHNVRQVEPQFLRVGVSGVQFSLPAVLYQAYVIRVLNRMVPHVHSC